MLAIWPLFLPAGIKYGGSCCHLDLISIDLTTRPIRNAHRICSLITPCSGDTVFLPFGNVVPVHDFWNTTLGISVQDKNKTKVVFSKRLASLMDAAGITQADLAERVGVTQTTVWKWRNGSVPDGISTVKIAEIFGVSESALFAEELSDTTLGVGFRRSKSDDPADGVDGSKRNAGPIFCRSDSSENSLKKHKNLSITKQRSEELEGIAAELKAIVKRLNRITRAKM